MDIPGINEEIYPSSGQAFDQDRGYGEANVFRTPGVNDRSDVEYVLNHPSVNENHGPYTLVIGDNPNGPGSIRIRLLAGLVVSANPHYEDPLGQHIWVPSDVTEKIINRHPEVGETEDEVVENLRRGIENADQIYEDGLLWRMYVTEVDGTLLFILVDNGGKVVTAYNPRPDQSREATVQYIKDQIEKYGFSKIYEDNSPS